MVLLTNNIRHVLLVDKWLWMNILTKNEHKSNVLDKLLN